MNALPNPFETFNSVALSSPSASADDTAVANRPVAAAVIISDPVRSPADRQSAPVISAGAVEPPTVPAAFSAQETEYIPELFSAYAARRCKDLISPPIQKPDRDVDTVVNFDALYSAITYSHPRDLDLDPPPLFLRKPRPTFLRALFELGGAQ